MYSHTANPGLLQTRELTIVTYIISDFRAILVLNCEQSLS
jgi:hypothetical protein